MQPCWAGCWAAGMGTVQPLALAGTLRTPCVVLSNLQGEEQRAEYEARLAVAQKDHAAMQVTGSWVADKGGRVWVSKSHHATQQLPQGGHAPQLSTATYSLLHPAISVQTTVESLQASLEEKTAQLAGVQQALETASATGEAAQHQLQQRVAALEAQLCDSASAAQAAEERLAGLQQQLSELADAAAAKEAELAGEGELVAWRALQCAGRDSIAWSGVCGHCTPRGSPRQPPSLSGMHSSSTLQPPSPA